MPRNPKYADVRARIDSGLTMDKVRPTHCHLPTTAPHATIAVPSLRAGWSWSGLDERLGAEARSAARPMVAALVTTG